MNDPLRTTGSTSAQPHTEPAELGASTNTDGDNRASSSGTDATSLTQAEAESATGPSASAELGELQEQMEYLTQQLQRCEITRAEYETRHREKEAERERAIAATPYYWARVLCAHPALGSFITTRDCVALHALRGVRCVRRGVDFDLMFSFDADANAAFDNRSLTKSYRRYEKRGLVIGQDPPRWRQGYEPPEGEDSFFDFFRDPEDPHLLGELLRDEIIPKSVSLFRGGWTPNDAGFDDSDDDTESTASTNSAHTAAAAASQAAVTSPSAPGSSFVAGSSSAAASRS